MFIIFIDGIIKMEYYKSHLHKNGRYQGHSFSIYLLNLLYRFINFIEKKREQIFSFLFIFVYFIFQLYKVGMVGQDILPILIYLSFFFY